VEPDFTQDIPLPSAIEKMLAYKDDRSEAAGRKDSRDGDIDEAKLLIQEREKALQVLSEHKTRKQRAQEETERHRRAKRNQKKRDRKKNKKKQVNEQTEQPAQPKKTLKNNLLELAGVQIEYITQEPDLNDPNLYQFKKVFEKFRIAEKEVEIKQEPEKEYPLKSKEKVIEKTKGFGEESSDEDESKLDEDGKEKLSKKKLRRMNRLSVAELKQLVARPDVVEMHDVTAQDPRFLVHLKATRNSVTVPRHWCFKRKYLQGKRGFEKPPFQLPECIKNTGITEMRQALQDKEDQRTMKTKMREKVRPKLGKIDIDYQKLHDAFFRYQTKPRMTIHGDLYYEGKEFETRLKEKKPGDLSDDLRNALGMPTISSGQKVPPPWLIAMQRYGPPPSYPNLKIPGLNTPIPEGCSFGYHAGGWGKPPVDEYGRPLYGDVFGTQGGDAGETQDLEDVDTNLWGELESESEESSSEEEDDGDEDEIDESGRTTPSESLAGIATPSGISSVPSGMETPDMIELRKKKIEDAMEGGDTPQLYQVIPEKATGIGRSMMGSSHVYDMSRRPAATTTTDTRGGVEAEGIEIALNPEELEMDSSAMAAKFEQQVREQQIGKEDFSDLVAEHAVKQKKKRKAQTQDGNKPTKKYKDFKF